MLVRNWTDAVGSIPAMVLTIAAATYILYIAGVAVYNVAIHPLANFPGPKKWAAFWWPHSFSMFWGTEVQDLANLHAKYGEIVRIAPNTLSFSGSQAWKGIHGFQKGKRPLPKEQSGFKDEQAKLPPHIFQANDADHARYRRSLSHAFSDNALREQEDLLNTHFVLFLQKLREQIDSPSKGMVNMVAWYNYLTFDIIGDLSFGESFHAVEGGKYHPMISHIFRTITHGRWLRLGAQYPTIWRTAMAFQWLLPDIRSGKDDHIRETREIVKRRLETDSDRKDFFHFILRQTNGNGMTKPEMISNASAFLIAGSETTATLLSGATYYLLLNPDKLKRLQYEVRSKFSSVDEMTLASVSRLSYLQAVIEESLRMYPPVANSTPRIVPPEGAMIDGRHIPGDTVVGVHQWSTYRNSNNFVDPDIFAPERFLRDPPAKYRNDKLEALQPFAIGPRSCMGKNLAYNEMRAILARMVFCFDWELRSESVNWKDQKTYFFWQKGDLMVQLRSRE